MFIYSYDNEYTPRETVPHTINGALGFRHIMGIPNETSITELFETHIEVIGDGYAVVTSSCGEIAGTGTVVDVYNSSDVLVETYYVIIGGDSNGDSLINNIDFTILSNWFGGSEYEDFTPSVVDTDSFERANHLTTPGDGEDGETISAENTLEGIYFTQAFVNGTIHSPHYVVEDYESGDLYIDQRILSTNEMWDAAV